MSIKVILFDFGGVFYNIDYYAATRELSKFSLNPALFENMPFLKVFDLPADYEQGLFNDTEFRNFLREKYLLNCDDDDIDKAWNSMLLGLKPESISFLKKINEKYRTALLSNTNNIHLKYFDNESVELLNLFEKVFFSFQIGLRKPDKEIYLFAAEKLNVKTEEILFIDDSEINIKGAESVGMNIIHFTNSMTLSDLLHSI